MAISVVEFQALGCEGICVDFLLKKEQIQRGKNSNVIMASLNTSKKN